MSQEEPNAKKARIATDSVEKKMDDVSELIDGIWSEDRSLQLESTIKFKRILSLDAEKTPSTENLIQSGVVARFTEFLDKNDSPKLQHEATWAIANLACDKPDVVVDNGAVPILVNLLASPNDDVLERAIWALCIVAGGSIQNRDYVLRCGVLLPLCSKLNEDTTKLSILRIGTRTLLTFCRGLPVSFMDKAPTPLFDKVKSALPTVKRLLHSNDEQVLKDACSALFYMSYGSQAGIQSVIDAGFIPRLVQLLQHSSSFVLCHVLGIIWILTSKDNQQIQHVIDGGALPILFNMLTQDYEKSIKENSCVIIAEIAAGTEEQIQSVIDANLIPILVNLAQNAELGIKIEAATAISKATKGGSHDQIKYLVGKSCIKPLCDNLLCEGLRLIKPCLDGLESILKVGEAEKNKGDHRVNYYRQLIIDAQGQKKIENLRSHNDYEIKEKAVKIMKKYWLEQEDEETQLQLRPPRG